MPPFVHGIKLKPNKLFEECVMGSKFEVISRDAKQS